MPEAPAVAVAVRVQERVKRPPVAVAERVGEVLELVDGVAVGKRDSLHELHVPVAVPEPRAEREAVRDAVHEKQEAESVREPDALPRRVRDADGVLLRVLPLGVGVPGGRPLQVEVMVEMVCARIGDGVPLLEGVPVGGRSRESVNVRELDCVGATVPDGDTVPDELTEPESVEVRRNVHDQLTVPVGDTVCLL